VILRQPTTDICLTHPVESQLYQANGQSSLKYSKNVHPNFSQIGNLKTQFNAS
jgi:hypothetical protein